MPPGTPSLGCCCFPCLRPGHRTAHGAVPRLGTDSSELWARRPQLPGPAQYTAGLTGYLVWLHGQVWALGLYSGGGMGDGLASVGDTQGLRAGGCMVLDAL